MVDGRYLSQQTIDISMNNEHIRIHDKLTVTWHGSSPVSGILYGSQTTGVAIDITKASCLLYCRYFTQNAIIISTVS